MDSLVVANILHRPIRTLASAAGVALGVVLSVVTIGLAHGMLQSKAQRESNLGAELLFSSHASIGPGISSTPLSLPVGYASALSRIEGVRAATPVARYIRQGSRGLGFEILEGVAFQPTGGYATYAETTGLRIVRGRMPRARDELIVDYVRARATEIDVGARFEALGREFEVVGVYEPEIAARVKMPLETLQELLSGEDKCSWILIQCDSPELQEAVAARIDQRFPGNQIIFTRDIPTFYARALPALDVFLDAVIGLAMVIGVLVISLAMYTSVTEKTREIGILKSLGASKRFVAAAIGKEAMLIAAIGILMGITVSLLVQLALRVTTSLVVQIELQSLLIASGVSFLSGILGALYPALRAARQDPVKALAHE